MVSVPTPFVWEAEQMHRSHISQSISWTVPGQYPVFTLMCLVVIYSYLSGWVWAIVTCPAVSFSFLITVASNGAKSRFVGRRGVADKNGFHLFGADSRGNGVI